MLWLRKNLWLLISSLGSLSSALACFARLQRSWLVQCTTSFAVISHISALDCLGTAPPLPRQNIIKHAKSVILRAQGKDAIKFLEGLVVGDIAGIPDGQGSLSVFTNEQGGIIDDTVITKARSCSCLHVHGDTMQPESRQLAEAVAY